MRLKKPILLYCADTELLSSLAFVLRLSGILETGELPQRFYLSSRACRGILRRAEKRGKTLPPALAHALMAVAASHPMDKDPSMGTPGLGQTSISTAA